MIISQQPANDTVENITVSQVQTYTSGQLYIQRWLILCCVLVFSMIMIGAITRLTESGLSIVQWKPVTGVIPPLTDTQWQAEFNEYKTSPEFQKKNFWMTVDDFKSIYFWEWLHRLLGRIIGLTYALPFFIFLSKGNIPKGYSLKLGALVFLVAAQGFMGWYMVKSGLVNEPSVSHYRLAAHLGLALLLYALSFWYALNLTNPEKQARLKPDKQLHHIGYALFLLLCITITWGAFTAGLDAGLVYNDTFPMMGKNWVPEELTNAPTVTAGILETHAGVQFMHRWLAILTATCIAAYALFAIMRKKRTEKTYAALFVMILLQVSLGIITLFTGVHTLPAAAHQAGAVILLSLLITSLYMTKDRPLQPAHG